MGLYKCVTDEKGTSYIFDGDLEQYLLDRGITKQHIQHMQQKIMHSDDFRDYYDYQQEERKQTVPLKKVIGTSRATVGESVFENVRVMRQGDREPDRFQRCLDFLERMGLGKLLKSYEVSCPAVEMDCFLNDDKGSALEDGLYFVCGDGNHRTLIAMLLGAKAIRAKVTVYRLNTVRKEKCMAVKEFYDKYRIKKITEDLYDVNQYVVTFKREDGTEFEVQGFKKACETETCFDVIKRLSVKIAELQTKTKYLSRLPRVFKKMAHILFRNNSMLLQYWDAFEESGGNGKYTCSSVMRTPVHLWKI